MSCSVHRLILAVSLSLSCARQAQSSAPVPAPVAPNPASPALRSTPGAGRHIIRNAELSLEADDPARAEEQARAAIERLGGFTMSSDAVSLGQEPRRAELHVSLVLRVPAEAFESAIAELRTLGRGAGREQVTGEDVSDEYVDLDARIRTERALEMQLLEILKSTKVVSEMMEVHARLAQVRGEIEKMEGRRRLLDNQTSLSTIRLEITGLPLHGWPWISDSVRRASSDVTAVAAAIVTGGIRVAGVLLPIFVLLFVPCYTVARAVARIRARRAR
jgi:hypothetical protein